MNVRRRRLAAQLLDQRQHNLTDAVRHLLAVQAQDPSAFPLALRARVPGATAAELQAARENGSIVRCWGPRGTLHLIAREDLDWLYPLVKPAGTLRKLPGLDRERAVAVTSAALQGQGPLTKPELGERLARAGVSAEGQQIVHLAVLAAAEGLVVLGPERGGKPTYVHAADWLGAPLPVTVDAPDLGRLVARYRTAHDPSEPEDLAAWSGLPVGTIRTAWHGSEVDTRAPETGLRLIPAFDEYLLGWRGREHAVAPEHQREIHPGGGIIKAVVLVDGRVAGTWGARRSGTRLAVTVRPFEPLPEAQLAAEVEDLGVFLGLTPALVPGK